MQAKNKSIIFGEWDLWEYAKRCKTDAELWEWVRACQNSKLFPPHFTDQYIANFLKINQPIIDTHRFEWERYEEKLSDISSYGSAPFEIGHGRSGAIILDPKVHENHLKKIEQRKRSVKEVEKPDAEALRNASALLQKTQKDLEWLRDKNNYYHPYLGLFIVTLNERKEQKNLSRPSLVIKLYIVTDTIYRGKHRIKDICLSELVQPEFQLYHDDNVVAIMMSSIYDDAFINHICKYEPKYKERLERWLSTLRSKRTLTNSEIKP